MSAIVERVLLTRRVLRRLADLDFESISLERRANNGIKKQLRNKSAYISRMAARHYETMLADFVQSSERGIDAYVAEIRETQIQVNTLRSQLLLLEGYFYSDPIDRLLEEIDFLQRTSTQSSSPPSLVGSSDGCDSL